MKTSVITGVTGQDGAYLAQQLLDRGQKVYGAYRRTSSVNFWRLEELGILDHPDFQLVEFDLTTRVPACGCWKRRRRIAFTIWRRKVSLACPSSSRLPRRNMTGVGALHLLEAIRQVNNKIKFYQASTSELYGRVRAVPQNEDTPFYPRSPYAVAKLFAHWMTVNYREAYGMFASSGILFNHESPLRGREFVTRKITNCRGAHPSRQTRLLGDRQPRCAARLGIRQGIYAGNDLDHGSQRARDVCTCHRQKRQCARSSPKWHLPRLE